LFESRLAKYHTGDHYTASNPVLESSEKEDDVDDPEGILPGAQTLLALLPKIFPSDLISVETSAHYHHDLNLNNILVNEHGEVTAGLDWECASSLPFWMLSHASQFLEKQAREEEPQRDSYADETPEEAITEADKSGDPHCLNNESRMNCAEFT
jgi:hypothetical protein